MWRDGGDGPKQPKVTDGGMHDLPQANTGDSDNINNLGNVWQPKLWGLPLVTLGILTEYIWRSSQTNTNDSDNIPIEPLKQSRGCTTTAIIWRLP